MNDICNDMHIIGFSVKDINRCSREWAECAVDVMGCVWAVQDHMEDIARFSASKSACTLCVACFPVCTGNGIYRCRDVHCAVADAVHICII